jgi:UDP-N-acetylmuramyl tripeptide synthase
VDEYSLRRRRIYQYISQDHLDFHADLDDYAAAKAKLFRMIAPHGFVVINSEDAYAPVFKDAALVPVFTYARQTRLILPGRITFLRQTASGGPLFSQPVKSKSFAGYRVN